MAGSTEPLTIIADKKNEEIAKLIARQTDYSPGEISLLLESKAIDRRADSHVYVQGEKVNAGDVVRIDFRKCRDKLQSFPPELYRDYAFVTKRDKTDDYLDQMRAVLRIRKQTIVLDPDGSKLRASGPLLLEREVYRRAHLVDFLTFEGRSDIGHPVRNLIIVSHGNVAGLMEVPLDSPKVGVVVYEDLEKAEKSGALKIKTDSFQPRPKDTAGKEVVLTIHIRGCQIGAVPRYLEAKEGAISPFLLLLHKVLGGNIRLTAPKHTHAVAPHPYPRGWVEYMTYSFAVYRKEPLADLTAAADAFAAQGGFKYIDGSAVPDKQWREWLVAASGGKKLPINAEGQRNTEPIIKSLKPFNVKSPISQQMLKASVTFYYLKVSPFPSDFTGRLVRLEKEPATLDEKLRVIRAELEKKYFSPKHPFPAFGRLGYRTMDEFMNEMKWEEPIWDDENKWLVYDAYRYEYILHIPVVDPSDADRVLLCNFYPSTENVTSVAQSKVRELREEDGRLFSTIEKT